MKYPWLIKAYDADRTLIARCEPPFTFFIRFNQINQDIDYIKFDTIELITESEIFDLLELRDISNQTSISYYGKRKEPNHDPNHTSFLERDDTQTLQRLKEERGISIIELRSKGFAYFEEWIEESDYEYNEEERKMLHKERNFNFLFEVKYVPLNITDDEQITVNVSLIFILSNGNTQRIQFDDVYFREYSKHYYSSPHPFIPNKFLIESLPEEKNVKY
jgi:hypothetical protein